MSNYIKPTISLLDVGTSTASASTCSTSTTDAKEVLDILASMGVTEQAFASKEFCEFPFDFEDYCKFTSGIQIFYS